MVLCPHCKKMEMEEDFIDYRMSDCPNCGYVDIDESKCIE